MTGPRGRIVLVAGLAALALGFAGDAGGLPGSSTTLVSGGREAFDATFAAISDDGSRVFFTTEERLVAADTDSRQDVYEVAGGKTTLISTGPIGGNGADGAATFAAASTDGSRVLFLTSERLVSEDADAERDIYMRSGTVTTLVTIGNGYPTFKGASADALRVFFETAESLEPGDTNGSVDVYERAGQTTRRISKANGAYEAHFAGASADGSVVFYRMRFSFGDWDVYAASAGKTELVSRSLVTGRASEPATFVGASTDGTRAFFVTREQLVAADNDTSSDVYQRANGTTTLVSTGPLGGDGLPFARYAGASADGTRVFFETKQRLTTTDQDYNVLDVYERRGNVTTLISRPGSGGEAATPTEFVGASSDGRRVFFTSHGAVIDDDRDGASDVYLRTGDTTTLVSRGTRRDYANNATLMGLSADGTRVFFATAGAIVDADGDKVGDIYMRHGNTTVLVSGGRQEKRAGFLGAARDGSVVVFGTAERLVDADGDESYDLYESR